MASPFSVFRKNQKMWMAGITVMAIFAFVFLSGPMMSSFAAGQARRTRRADDQVREPHGVADFRALRYNRMVFIEFLRCVYAEQPTRQSAQCRACRRSGSMIGPATRSGVVNKWLFAREAEAMGITVDDKTVNDFLAALTNGKASAARHPQNSEAAFARGISAEATFLSILREELLALRYRQLFHQIAR